MHDDQPTLLDQFEPVLITAQPKLPPGAVEWYYDENGERFPVYVTDEELEEMWPKRKTP